jgi:hypothetical protein
LAQCLRSQPRNDGFDNNNIEAYVESLPIPANGLSRNWLPGSALSRRRWRRFSPPLTHGGHSRLHHTDTPGGPETLLAVLRTTGHERRRRSREGETGAKRGALTPHLARRIVARLPQQTVSAFLTNLEQGACGLRSRAWNFHRKTYLAL